MLNTHIDWKNVAVFLVGALVGCSIDNLLPILIRAIGAA